MDGSISIAANKFHEICSIQKGGGAGISDSELFKYIDLACEKATEITSKIVNAIEKSRESRKKLYYYFTFTYS